MQEEKALKEEEAEIRKGDMEIEKENKIVQHKLQEIQEERKSLVVTQDQLNHEYAMIKPLTDATIDEMEKLRLVKTTIIFLLCPKKSNKTAKMYSCGNVNTNICFYLKSTGELTNQLTKEIGY